MDHSEYTTVDLFYKEVDTAYHKWKEIAEYVGESYRQAYKIHKEVTDDNPLEKRIAASVISLVTWGSMKWMGLLVDSRVEQKKLTKTFKDWLYEPAIEVGKAISTEVKAEMVKKVKAKKAITLPPDPEKYKSDLVSNIESAIGSQKEFLTDLLRRCSDKGTASSDFRHRIDRARRGCWLLHFPDPESIKKDRKKMQTQMELCIWLRWIIKTAGYRRRTQTIRMPCRGGTAICQASRQVQVFTYHEPGSSVEKHLLKNWGRIGATMGRSEFWQDWPAWAQGTSQQEAKHLYTWAKIELQRRQRANSANDTKSGFGSSLPSLVKQNWGLV